MGAIIWGTRWTCYPTFSEGGDMICYVHPTFIFRFCIWRGFKNKSDVTVFREEFFMLDFTHSQADVETEVGTVSVILII